MSAPAIARQPIIERSDDVPKTNPIWKTTFLAAVLVAAVAGTASAGPVSAAKDAVDPDCTVGKAAKGAAERATVGVGNRCKPGETARDAVGLDGKKDRDKRDGKRRKKDD